MTENSRIQARLRFIKGPVYDHLLPLVDNPHVLRDRLYFLIAQGLKALEREAGNASPLESNAMPSISPKPKKEPAGQNLPKGEMESIDLSFFLDERVTHS